MSNAAQLTNMLLAKGLPNDDESSAIRNLRLTNSNIFNGALGGAVRDIVAVACKSKSPTYIANYERDTKLIMTNLIAVAFQWEWLGLGTRVSKGNYLDSLGLARRRIEDITEALIQVGYATLGRGGYRHHGNAGKSKSTQYYPTEKLLRLGAEMLYETAGDFDNYEPYEWQGEERWDVNEGQNIQILRNYNEFMRSHSWAQKAPTVRKLLSEPYTGGRVYTPYQNIVNRRVQIRSKTFLDGQPLVECDFSANHPYMLARLTGNAFEMDFYSVIAKGSNCDRAAVKAVITAAIGCPSPNKAHEMRYKLVTRGVNGETVDNILSTATDAYPWLREHNIFLSNKGVYMQWLEGEIAVKMFQAAVRDGIPMVNIHDAYAVNNENVGRVSALMNQYREEVLETYKPVLAI
uniref:hypothetical protein n=1 Tax=Shewanella sp. TaxID=50422 RepID=UPI00404730AA